MKPQILRLKLECLLSKVFRNYAVLRVIEILPSEINFSIWKNVIVCILHTISKFKYVKSRFQHFSQTNVYEHCLQDASILSKSDNLTILIK